MATRKTKIDDIVRYVVAGETSNAESDIIVVEPCQTSVIPKIKRNFMRKTVGEDIKNFIEKVW